MIKEGCCCLCHDFCVVCGDDEFPGLHLSVQLPGRVQKKRVGVEFRHVIKLHPNRDIKVVRGHFDIRTNNRNAESCLVIKDALCLLFCTLHNHLLVGDLIKV